MARSIFLAVSSSPVFVERNGDTTVKLYPSGAAVYYGTDQRTLTTSTGAPVTAGFELDNDVWLVAAGPATVEITEVTVLSANSRVAVVVEAPINVQYPEHGALGDGMTDDTDAITSAYDLAATTDDSEVYLPPGEYITRGNAVKGRTFGAGAGSTILKLADNAPVLAGMPLAHHVILTNRDSATGFENLTIEALELDGNVANNFGLEQTHAIELWGGVGLTIRALYIHDTRGEGIALGAATVSPIATEDGLVENIRLFNCGYLNGGPGLTRQGIAAFHARRLTIRSIRAEQIAANIIDLETDNATQTFEDCLIEDIAGVDCVNGVAIYGRLGGLAYRNTVRNVRLVGAGSLQAAVILDYTDGTLVDGVATDGTHADDIIVAPATNTNLRATNFPGDFCLLSRTSNQDSILNTTDTAIQWNVEEDDRGGMHDNTDATTRPKVNIVVPGVYQVSVNLRWSGTAGTYRQVYLRKNGTSSVGIIRNEATLPQQMCAFPAVKLAQGDYLELVVVQDSGGAEALIYDADAAPRLSVVKVA